ncbi:hypothetical protein E2C01_011718 [Portunus trituberculatus]|uniref:Uncharacterized protein n=1 Tax=Portunus trituberculatus TaxID=210409 RepID=A0A5B7DBU0_PORTR|nr:hypothetical protein [Portunus trituberculatus]
MKIPLETNVNSPKSNEDMVKEYYKALEQSEHSKKPMGEIWLRAPKTIKQKRPIEIGYHQHDKAGDSRYEVLGHTLHDEERCLHKVPVLGHVRRLQNMCHLLETQLGATDEHHVLDQLLHTLPELIEVVLLRQDGVLCGQCVCVIIKPWTV